MDAELVRRGLARSRDDAVELVASGAVAVGGRRAVKPATRVTSGTAITTRRAEPTYVSRGAYKLAGALADFGPMGLAVRGRRCMDVGASTGGFTEVLLGAGASTVVAVDVGTGQLAPSLSGDARVEVHDGVNARDLDVAAVGVADLIVVDVSFISLTLVLPAVAGCLMVDGDILAMVKPQFEVGRDGLDGRGVVRTVAQRVAALERVATAAADAGLGTRAAVASTRAGAAGNTEYFLWLRHDAPEPDRALLRAAVEPDPMRDDVPSRDPGQVQGALERGPR